MKKFVVQLSIVLIFAIAAVVLTSTLMYNYIANKYFDTKICESVSVVNKSVRTNIDVTIGRDYGILEYYVKNNTKSELITSTAELTDLSFSDIKFGELLADNHYLIDGIEFVPNNELYDTGYFGHDISIFNLKNDFTTFDKTITYTDHTYVIFKIDNTLVYTDAADYFMPLFKSSVDFLDNDYFIITKDGIIVYQKTGFDKAQLYNFLRSSNSSESVEAFKDAIYNYEETDTNVIHDMKLATEDVFIAFAKATEEIDAYDYYIVNIFNKANIRIKEHSVLIPALAGVIIYGVIAFFGLVICYYFIIKKNNEVQISRLMYNKDKVFTISLNADGKITGINQSCKMEIIDYQKYNHINDLTITESYETPFDAVKRQLPITILLDDEGKKKYLSFFTLKTMFGYRLIGRDATTKEHIIALQNEVLYNDVTHLPGMRILRSDLEELFNQKQEVVAGTVQPLPKRTLVIFDIARFKSFNDLFGRRIGDLILTNVAEMIVNSTNEFESKVYQLESNTFAVYFEDGTSREKVIDWVTKSVERFKRPLLIEGNELVITAKYGISYIDRDLFPDLTAASAISNAYLALQKAQTYANMQYAEYDLGLNAFVTKEQIMENDLRLAIENNEFAMYLQPQYNNAEERIEGFEALIRWDNPKYRSQSPARFIELAEKNNMIIKIGRFVIHETFRIAKELEKYDIRISMNVSPVQLLQAGFVNEIIDEYKKANLRKGAVAIEITETFLMNNFTVVIEKMKLLRQNGFDIHLDDFGTGYSSMLYLRELPIDLIKIDKEFIKHINTDKYSQAIVSKIISLSRILDLGCIAEGVEDDKQNQFLYKNGCDVIQGYLISAAVNENDALKLVDEYNMKKSKMIKSTKSTKTKEKL